MERVLYEQMSDFDQHHWWFSGRRTIIAELMRRVVRPPADASILEIGCGTGHNLSVLAKFGYVDALELDDQARAIAERRLGREALKAVLPELEGVPDRNWDVIAAFDVIEHIDRDDAALASIADKLKPGGKFIMTVPAHQWMWSQHDVLNHHKRRYSKAGLKRLIENSPLKLDALGFFNSLLFPIAVARRLVARSGRDEEADLGPPPAPVNAALQKTFSLERHLVGRVPLPPGLSLYAVASVKPVEH